MAASLNNLRIETAGTVEEAAEQLEAAKEMEVEETGKGEEVDNETRRALVALEFLTQDAEPSGTTPIDACHGFNELSHLAMLWAVQHRCPAGVRFPFNCYRHWAHILLRELGQPSVPILS